MRNDNSARDLKNVNDGKVTSDQSSHPAGTTLGTLGGAAAGVGGAIVAGAAAGSAIGPVGAAVGAVIGAAIGAKTGHDIAAQINPKEEDLYWRANYIGRPYVKAGTPYEYYQPAYNFGVESATKYQGKRFDEVETTLAKDWDSARRNQALGWEDAKPATRDAFNRLNNNE